MNDTAPLTGIRVLDLSRLLPGPYCSSMLADLGCEVIKVEEPVRGDYYRAEVPKAFAALNRGKKSITVDFKNLEDKKKFLDLVETCDVLLESFRPGVTKRLGIGYDDLVEINSKLIYVSLTGYGQTGPYAMLPGHDINYYGVAGLLGFSASGNQKHDIPSYVTIADLNASSFCLSSILLALLQRKDTSLGQYIDVSITDCAVSWLARYLNDGVKNRNDRLTKPGYGVFETEDSRFLSLACLEEKFWDNLWRIFGKGFKEEVQKTKNSEINNLIAAKIAEKPFAYWEKVFVEYDIPFAIVNELDDLENDPHLKTRELIFTDENGTKCTRFPVKFSMIKYPEQSSPAPTLGEHNKTILGDSSE